MNFISESSLKEIHLIAQAIILENNGNERLYRQAGDIQRSVNIILNQIKN